MLNRTLFAGIFLVGLQHAASAEHRSPELKVDDVAIIQSSVFAQAHPDLRFRLSAISHIDAGRHASAWDDLHRAARFGDKASQALIAESYWLGSLGQPQDRSLAYAWMDLAAERGYPLLVAKREAYWQGLDASQQARAIERGQQIYAEFGDAAALPRLAQRLAHGKRQQTGSRVGASTGTDVYLADNSKMVINFQNRIRGKSVRPLPPTGGKKVDLWNDKFWKLDDYMAWKAVELDAALSGRAGGVVDVLPIQAEAGRL